MNYLYQQLKEAKMQNELAQSESPQEIQRPTITNRIKGQIEDLEKRLAQLKTVEEKLEKNPDLQEVMDAIYKLSIY